jgi:hypothetical protein
MANYLGSLPGQDEALTNNPGSNLDSFYTDENWIFGKFVPTKHQRRAVTLLSIKQY